MTIKFIADYTVGDSAPETFTAGQVVEGRSAASELHFVRRGKAAYMDADGNLTDVQGNPVADPTAEAVPAPLDPPPAEAGPEEIVATRGAKAKAVKSPLKAKGDPTQAPAAPPMDAVLGAPRAKTPPQA